MLRHIGLHIHNENEVAAFYENILKFKEINRFSLHPNTAKAVFNTEDKITVVRMRQFDIVIELLIYPENTNPGMSHIAFEFWKTSDIIAKARQSNYEVIEFEKQDGIPAKYIKDKAGNIFEIKDINLI